MISLSKNFLFILVPKTGGSSVKHSLLPHIEDKMIGEEPLKEGIDQFGLGTAKLKFKKHATLEDYRQHVEPEIFKKLYKFAVMRNPWERMISYYFSPHRGRAEWDRDQFIRLVSWVPPLRHYVAPHSFETKLRFTFDCFLGKPGQKLGNEVHLMRFENLREDFQQACDLLKMDMVDLGHRNTSSRKHYSEYYDPELIELVRKRHLEEITYGSYSFDHG